MKDDIQRLASITYADFQREYAHKHRPVILTDATNDWPARQWTPENLAERFGDRPVTINERSDHATEMTLGEYVQLARQLPERTGPWEWRAGTSADSAPYMRGVFLWRFSPELLREVAILPYFLPNWLTRSSFRSLAIGEPIWVDLFMGSPGASFPSFHYDNGRTHNWFCQIYGTKHFWVSANDQAPFLRDAQGKMIDTFPPPVERYPNAHQAAVIEFDLHPGEILFIPSGLWHTTTTHMLNISVSGNFVNDTNIEPYLRELKLTDTAFKYVKAESVVAFNRVLDRLEGEPTFWVWEIV